MDTDGIKAEAQRIMRAFVEAEELRRKADRDITALANIIAEWYPDATQPEIADLQGFLYWDTDLPFRDWPKAIHFRQTYSGPRGLVYSSAGPRPFRFTCSVCGCEFDGQASSRSSLAFGTGVCQECQDAKDSRQSSVMEEYRLMIEERQREARALRAMPYREYLQTDHWQAVRKDALRRAGYRCSACNANGQLDVHHRTYERRGAEHRSDVLALCRDCHTRFHIEVTA